MVLSPMACLLDTQRAACTRIAAMWLVSAVGSVCNEWFKVQFMYAYPDYQWTFQTYQSLFFYCIPLVVTAIAYGKMRVRLRATAKQFEQSGALIRCA